MALTKDQWGYVTDESLLDSIDLGNTGGGGISINPDIKTPVDTAILPKNDGGGGSAGNGVIPSIDLMPVDKVKVLGPVEGLPMEIPTALPTSGTSSPVDSPANQIPPTNRINKSILWILLILVIVGFLYYKYGK